MNPGTEIKQASTLRAIRKRGKSRRIWLLLLLALLAAGSAGGYYYWLQRSAVTVQSSVETVRTSQVRNGSITISASGSGTLVAGQESQLTFSVSGTIAEVLVQVGDQVQQGQVLARLGDLDDLQAGVSTAEQNLISAQQSLETLKENAPARLANAHLAVTAAEKTLISAKAKVVTKDMARCDQETIDAYFQKYAFAQQQLEKLQEAGGDASYYLSTIVPQKKVVGQAYNAYKYCAGYVDYEIRASQASYNLAEAQLKQAQSTLDTLTANGGIDPLELATAENTISSAQVALEQAKKKLAGTAITAPYDGTILSVAGQAGDTAETGAFITLADLARPQVEFSVDENDLEKLALGQKAHVTFDALPGSDFGGTVIRIYPALVSSGGYQVVKGLIQLDLEVGAATLPKGLNGSVELIQATAEDVLLVPQQAVRDLGDGSYAVFVVGADGNPKMRVVEVGLMDAASAEIKSGLAMGDVVTTGIMETR